MLLLWKDNTGGMVEICRMRNPLNPRSRRLLNIFVGYQISIGSSKGVHSKLSTVISATRLFWTNEHDEIQILGNWPQDTCPLAILHRLFISSDAEIDVEGMCSGLKIGC